MNATHSVDFFDKQFKQQIRENDFGLNPFEQVALPHLHGRVLDLGCGIGNLTVEAARRGCEVTAVDASAAAIEHLRWVAEREGLAIEATQSDLRGFEIRGAYDAIVCIGLLMFVDCPTALRTLASIRAHALEGGVAIVNLLVQGTTYTDMFGAGNHCLLARGELVRSFCDWQVILFEYSEFTVADGRIKAFETVIARRPDGALSAPAA